MSVGFDARSMGMFSMMDPDAYAKQYAEKNNMSVDEAKQELKSQYGDPQNYAMSASSQASIWNTSDGPMQMGDPNPPLGIDDSVFGSGYMDSNMLQIGSQMNPDAYAQQYAKENNISFEEAKQQLQAQNGDPSLGGRFCFDA